MAYLDRTLRNSRKARSMTTNNSVEVMQADREAAADAARHAQMTGRYREHSRIWQQIGPLNRLRS